MRPVVVVKVGGSLLDWPGLPARLAEYLASQRDTRLLLIAGGGPFVETLRDLDRLHGLGEEASHHLALRALDLTAHALAALVPGLKVVSRFDQLPRVWDSGRTPVLSPRLLLDDEDCLAPDPLPHTWSITSDSIAAHVAKRLGAGELLLLKSVNLPMGTKRDEAARKGLVDPIFPAVASGIDRVVYWNLRDSRDGPRVLD